MAFDTAEYIIPLTPLQTEQPTLLSDLSVGIGGGFLPLTGGVLIGAVVPTPDDAIRLGGASNYWTKVYTTQLLVDNLVAKNGSNIAIADDLIGLLSGTQDLGSISKWFQFGYIDDVICDSIEARSGSTISVKDHLSPNSDDTYNLGSATLRYTGVHAKILRVWDFSADPAINGEITKNGDDVKVMSGGAVRNFSNFADIIIVRKTSDESVTSSAALQDDNDLLFAIGANETWIVEITLFYSASTTGDLHVKLAIPSGAALRHGHIALDVTATTWNGLLNAFADDSTSSMLGAGAGNTDTTFCYYAVVQNGATPGSVILQWAQATSHSTSTVVREDSYLKAFKA